MTTRLLPGDPPYIAALLDNHARLNIRTFADGTELPTISIQGDLPALEWLADVTGVTVQLIPKGYNRHQCSDHCPQAHTRVESTSRRWTLTGARATIVLQQVNIYMRVQDRDARRLADLGRGVGFKPATVADMEAHGWTVPEELG